MRIVDAETKAIRNGGDIVYVRQTVQAWAISIGLSPVDQTKIATAASELARNTLQHGGGGTVRIEALLDTDRRGLRLTFDDRGPGILNIEQALTDGFSTGRGLGLGLGGARRLVNEFEIESTPGVGTRVSVTRWAAGPVRTTS